MSNSFQEASAYLAMSPAQAVRAAAGARDPVRAAWAAVEKRPAVAKVLAEPITE